MKSYLFVLRITLTWVATAIFFAVLFASVTGRGKPEFFVVAILLMAICVFATAFSHVRRVGILSDHVDGDTLANRHRRIIEMPMEANDAFDLVEAAIRELARVEEVEPARGSLQIEARVRRPTDNTEWGLGRNWDRLMRASAKRDRITAVIIPGEGTSTVRLVTEPEGGPWADWYLPDGGASLQNMAGFTRGLTRRLAERVHRQQTHAKQATTEKELAVAKLSLLHAQVEPHFLYNTLASAQYLTRSDPARADQMLGHLITYLRNSLPRTEDAFSTLGEELERARAYLEILKIRMGDRLTLQIQVPEALKRVPMPPMMLQTLVENAIKHGLEPVSGGGTVWILARESDGKVAVTVADDGRGFSEEGGGTGIGLKNIRERLALGYGEGATFTIVANFPKGVAATITVPAAGPKGGVHA